MKVDLGYCGKMLNVGSANQGEYSKEGLEHGPS